MGAVAGSETEVKSRRCCVFFKDERNNSKFVFPSVEGNFSPSTSKTGFISLFASFPSLANLVP